MKRIISKIINCFIFQNKISYRATKHTLLMRFVQKVFRDNYYIPIVAAFLHTATNQQPPKHFLFHSLQLIYHFSIFLLLRFISRNPQNSESFYWQKSLENTLLVNKHSRLIEVKQCFCSLTAILTSSICDVINCNCCHYCLMYTSAVIDHFSQH